MKDEYSKLTKRVDEVSRAVVWAVVWLTLVIIVGAVVSAFGGENYEVEIHSFSCYQDARFFDDWRTVSEASIHLDMNKAEMNRHDIEVWSRGLRIASYPASVERVDISGIVKPSIKIVNRETLERRTLSKSPWQSLVSCQIMPPPDGAAWVWSSETMKFELRIVRHVDDIEPFDFEMKWTSEWVEVVE
jgi:hypothetical protein